MYNNTKKILFKLAIIIWLLISATWVSANQVDFYGEKNSNWNILKVNNISILNSSLKNFYKNTWLNTDIVILWKWHSCYLNNNFDSCLQKKENYSSDLIIILSMKSDIKNKWDIRSLIKDEFKESITPRELKNLQDNITIYFKKNNFTEWLKFYLNNLEHLIKLKCNKVWILDNNCDAIKLAKEYHSYVAKKQAESKYNAFIRNIYILISFIWIILWYLWLRLFYKYSLNNLYKDTKYKIKSIWEYKIFDKDKENILNKLEWLKKVIKIKLWDLDKNAFSLRTFYKKQKLTYINIELEIKKMQESFNKKEELKDKITKFKNIDL